MGGKSAPKSPDYTAAAQQASEASRDVTEQQTWANRPDQVTPFGTTSWQNQMQWDPSTQQYLNRWTQRTDLPPELEQAAQYQKEMTRDRSGLAASFTNRLQNEYGTAMDWSGLPERGKSVDAPMGTEGLPNLDPTQRYVKNASDAIYGQWADRALPEQARQESALRTRLSNQGLREGDRAYDLEMQKMRESSSDAQRQAQYQATMGAGQEAQRYLGMDASTRGQLWGERGTQFNQMLQASQYQNQLRQQGLAEEMQKRGWSLNEMNAILGGQQVGMPNMPNFSQAGAAQGADYLGAAQMTGQANLDRFNAQQQAMQGMMSGVGSIAGSFPGFSDRRLKRDIHRVGSLAGVPLYTWTYIWGEPGFGVMADEVPHAIAGYIAGFALVDYGRIW